MKSEAPSHEMNPSKATCLTNLEIRKQSQEFRLWALGCLSRVQQRDLPYRQSCFMSLDGFRQERDFTSNVIVCVIR